MKALLIIDMQRGSFKPYSLRHDTPGTIERINLLSAHFRLKEYPVLFIQHNGTKEQYFLPGTSDWEILPDLIKLPIDITVSKTANDAFYKTELQNILDNLQVDALYITGCATDFCVDATIKSALSKDYKIVVAADGHTTASRPHSNAETLINHYNWLWDDMTPTRHKIDVVKTSEILV